MKQSLPASSTSTEMGIIEMFSAISYCVYTSQCYLQYIEIVTDATDT